MNDLINGAALTGTINGSSELVGIIQPAQFLRGMIAISGAEDSYDDGYIVTPRVHALPYYETSNLSGKTVYIGGE